jgi:lambda family phage minor tail protein L
MPHSVPAEYLQTKNAKVNKPIRLYTLHNYDGSGTNLCLAEYKTNIVFDGVTYAKFPITIGPITENARGEVDATRVLVSNVSREIQYYLENYELRGKKLSIYQVWADQLADTDNYKMHAYYIDRIESSAKVVAFDCLSLWDINDAQVPACLYLRGNCEWIKTGGYKGTQCGSVSAEASCDGTMANCRARNNISRYGGFPSIPSQRTVAY